MAKYECTIVAPFDEVLSQLEQDITANGLTMNLVDSSDFTNEHFRIAIRVYDKYYFRNSNRTSLNLTIAGEGDSLFISAIGAGGGQGIIWNFSLGAESDMVDIVEKSLTKFK